MSSLELKFVFGLFVLCVLQSFFIEAQHFKLFPKTKPAGRPIVLPGVPRNSLQSQRQNLGSAFSSQTSLNSLTNVNLHSSSSSLSSPSIIRRTGSLPSLNIANSPSIMKETSSISHSQAASVLNPIIPAQIQQNPSIAQRLIPNFGGMKPIGTYLKNGAIGVAATGGIVAIVHAINGNGHDEKRRKPTEEEVIENLNRIGNGKNITTTTIRPEYHNPLGIIYK